MLIRFEQSVTRIERDVSNFPGPFPNLPIFIKVTRSGSVSFFFFSFFLLIVFDAFEIFTSGQSVSTFEHVVNRAQRRRNFSRSFPRKFLAGHTSVGRNMDKQGFSLGKYENTWRRDRIFSWKIVLDTIHDFIVSLFLYSFTLSNDNYLLRRLFFDPRTSSSLVKFFHSTNNNPLFNKLIKIKFNKLNFVSFFVALIHYNRVLSDILQFSSLFLFFFQFDFDQNLCPPFRWSRVNFSFAFWTV